MDRIVAGTRTLAQLGNLFARTVLVVATAAAPGGGVHLAPNVQSTPTPGGRMGAYMVWDAARREIVLFGGNRRDASGVLEYPDDLWAWNGEAWRRLVPPAGSPRPRGRDAPHLAYDVARDRVVLSGGRREPAGGSMELLDDTWEWDGARWHEMRDAASPPVLHAIVGYDPARRRVMLFGGGEVGAGFTLSKKLYEWNGVRWTVRDTAGPGNNIPGAHVFMPDGRWIVVLGTPGRDSDAVPGSSSVAEWSGTAWVAKEAGPPFSNLQAAAGAQDGTLYFYQSWDRWLTAPILHVRSPSGVWRQVTVPTNPGIRATVAAAYDEVRDRFVIFGGRGSGNYLTDTWEFDGSAWHRR